MLSERTDALIQQIRQRRAADAIDLSDRHILTSNLLFLHDCVIATQPLMKDAVSVAARIVDPYCHMLAFYYRNHHDEEEGHLQWLLDDMAALGITPNDPPDALAMAMIGSQYYMLKHVHPATLLGYFAVAEGEPTSLDLVDRIEAIHGPLHFIRQHAVSDLEHRRDVYAMIDVAPDAVYPAIQRSADHVLGYYSFAARSWRNAEG